MGGGGLYWNFTVYYLLDGIIPQQLRFQAISSVIQSAATWDLMLERTTAKDEMAGFMTEI